MFGTFRTFLALMVVALHLGGIPRVGAYAVFGFYCLSGYLMTLIMHTNYSYTVAGTMKYAVNRFLRIYPLYWFSIVVSSVLIWLLGAEFTSDYHHSMYLPVNASDAIKNIFLFFPFRESPRLTPPAWALTVEIFFYILIGIGISKNKRYTLIWFLVSALYHVGALLSQLGWAHRYSTILAASLPFSTGALIFHFRQECPHPATRLHGNAYHYLPYLLAAAILINWLAGHVLSQGSGVFFYSNYILCSCMVAALSDRRELPAISNTLDRWIGDFSYPLYLIHYQAGIIAVVLLAVFNIHVTRPNLMLMFASVPLMIIFSWMMTVVLERPIEAIRSRIKR